MESSLILGPRDKPSSKGKWVVFSFQQLFAMFGATVLVPLIVGLPTEVALFTAGIGTLLYILATRAKVPVFLGSSFAFLPLAFAVGPEALPLGVLIWGIIYIVIAGIIALTGTKWINKALPPVVIGPVIMVIGLSLAPIAIGWIGLTAGADNYLDSATVLTATITFMAATIVLMFGKGTIKALPILIAIGVGYFTSVATGLVDFSVVIDSIKTAGIINAPNFNFVWTNSGVEFWEVFFVVLPLTLVTMAEHIGDHKVISEICGQDFTQDPGLHRTLLGDGLATAVAGICGGPVNTTYGENTSTVQISKIGSVYVTGLAAIFAVILAFITPISIILQSINPAVLGGVSLVLFGMIAFNGVKILVGAGKEALSEKSMIIISVMLVIGLGGATIAFTIGSINFAFSGVALTVIIGMILNGLLNYIVPLVKGE